jgi:hypothetical protein
LALFAALREILSPCLRRLWHDDLQGLGWAGLQGDLLATPGVYAGLPIAMVKDVVRNRPERLHALGDRIQVQVAIADIHIPNRGMSMPITPPIEPALRMKTISPAAPFSSSRTFNLWAMALLQMLP